MAHYLFTSVITNKLYLYWLIDWLIDFKRTSTHLWLIYASIYENHVYYTFVFTFFSYSCFLKGFFFASSQIRIIFKMIDLTHRWDPNRYYYSGSKWIWEWWQWRSTQHSPDLQTSIFIIKCPTQDILFWWCEGHRLGGIQLLKINFWLLA